MHQNKGKTIAKSLRDRTEYAKNGEKTENGEYVTSYECNAEIADQEFLSARAEYAKNHRIYNGDIIAYQIRQSFKPGEITPEEANRVGYETAMRFTKGQHAFIVATHTDRAHIHNHIIFNSVNLAGDRKFRDFFFSGIALQRLSDLVCLENGLSVIERRKPSEREARTVFPKRKKYRVEICDAIDAAIGKKPKDFEELLKLLEENYDVKRGRYPAIRCKDQERFIRFSSLGAGYSESDIKKKLLGEMPRRDAPQKEEFDMLLNIQEIMAKKKGVGYERWAKVYNIKQVSKALLFLQEQDCRDLEELRRRTEEHSAKFSEISKEIKEIEARLAEIAVLRTHISNYAKTKDVYQQYKQLGFSHKYFEAHREEITLHKAAKDAFKKLEKIPKMKDLNVEYGELLARKKKLFADYRDAKELMKTYQTAKYNIERLLNITEEEERGQEEKRKKKDQHR